MVYDYILNNITPCHKKMLTDTVWIYDEIHNIPWFPSPRVVGSQACQVICIFIEEGTWLVQKYVTSCFRNGSSSKVVPDRLHPL